MMNLMALFVYSGRARAGTSRPPSPCSLHGAARPSPVRPYSERPVIIQEYRGRGRKASRIKPKRRGSWLYRLFMRWFGARDSR